MQQPTVGLHSPHRTVSFEGIAVPPAARAHDAPRAVESRRSAFPRELATKAMAVRRGKMALRTGIFPLRPTARTAPALLAVLARFVPSTRCVGCVRTVKSASFGEVAFIDPHVGPDCAV